MQKSLVCLPERIKPPSQHIGANSASIFELCSRGRDQPDSVGNAYEAGASDPSPANVSLDISSLREKSKNLDLPLISALCNDKTLLKQTNTRDACGAAVVDDPFETSGNSWYNSPEEPLPEPCFGGQLSATVAAAYDPHPASATAFVEPGAVVLRAATKANVDVARSLGAVATAVTTSTASFAATNGFSSPPRAAAEPKHAKETSAAPLFAKIKPHPKLSKPSVSTSSKLRYTISQPIQKTVAKVKGSSGSGSASFVEAKNSFVNRVRCKSSKVRSADLSGVASSGRTD